MTTVSEQFMPARLLTASGRKVAIAKIPWTPDVPGVLQWGIRTFVFNDEWHGTTKGEMQPIYRESRAVTVMFTEEFGEAA